MVGDDLSTPLGIDLEPKKKKERRSYGPAFLSLALVLTGSVAGFLIMTKDPLGGEPIALATIERPAILAAATPSYVKSSQSNQQEGNTSAAPLTENTSSTSGRSIASELEFESGVKVVRQNGGAAPSAVIIRVPETSSLKLSAAPDRRLAEKSKHGILPRLSSEGLRPLDVYARPVPQALKSKQTRIAIIVGGLGIGQNVTSEAIVKLPGEVTLAFAPYGSDLERQAQKARDNGHELLLQAPMEPYDYPDNDPGPQTLLANQNADQNLDKLHWLMSRFTGYVGVMNFMGAKFSSHETAFAPVLKDISSRGLSFIDDGSSARSLGSAIAGSVGLPSAKADMIVDSSLKSGDIDGSLLKLEQIAREKGLAIGVGSALPLTVERIAKWSKSLEQKGIVLVPISSIVIGSKS